MSVKLATVILNVRAKARAAGVTASDAEIAAIIGLVPEELGLYITRDGEVDDPRPAPSLVPQGGNSFWGNTGRRRR